LLTIFDQNINRIGGVMVSVLESI